MAIMTFLYLHKTGKRVTIYKHARTSKLCGFEEWTMEQKSYKTTLGTSKLHMISTLSALFPTGITPMELLEIIVGLIVVWIIASIPAYIAGKIVARGKATFGEAMEATLLGPIVYIIVLAAADFVLGGLIGSGGYIAGFILAFIAWIWAYKAIFKTAWLGGLAIAILTIIVFAGLLIVIGALFGVLNPFTVVSSIQKL